MPSGPLLSSSRLSRSPPCPGQASIRFADRLERAHLDQPRLGEQLDHRGVGRVRRRRRTCRDCRSSCSRACSRLDRDAGFCGLEFLDELRHRVRRDCRNGTRTARFRPGPLPCANPVARLQAMRSLFIRPFIVSSLVLKGVFWSAPSVVPRPRLCQGASRRLERRSSAGIRGRHPERHSRDHFRAAECAKALREREAVGQSSGSIPAACSQAAEAHASSASVARQGCGEPDCSHGIAPRHTSPSTAASCRREARPVGEPPARGGVVIGGVHAVEQHGAVRQATAQPLSHGSWPPARDWRRPSRPR